MDKQAIKERQKIKFSHQKGDEFLSTLKLRVDQYFKDNQLTRYATPALHFKSCLFFSLMLFLYLFIIFQVTSNVFVLLILAMVLGVVKGYFGINLSHDAVHGAYSPNSKVNKILGYTYDLIGMSSYVWKLTHNFQHHTYTNIPGHDPDIAKPFFLRLSPQGKHYWFHRFQQIYIWVLYSFVALNWVLITDYVYFFQECKKMSKKDISIFFLFKVINLAVFLFIPLMVMTLPWWQIVIGYLALMLTGGFAVALVFQLAHLVENVGFFEPDDNGSMDTHWGTHEMLTTANFGTNSALLTYICGGLNFQIEHHLMSHISHVHYKNIQPIVKQTAAEFGLPYYENPTLWSAIVSHYKTLKRLGQGEGYL